MVSDVEFSAEDCVIADRHVSPYVTASFERAVSMSGCAGRELTATKLEETHAVNLKHVGHDPVGDAKDRFVSVFIIPGSHSPGNLPFLFNI